MAYVPASTVAANLEILRKIAEHNWYCEYCKGKFDEAYERTCKRCGAEKEEYRRA